MGQCWYNTVQVEKTWSVVNESPKLFNNSAAVFSPLVHHCLGNKWTVNCKQDVYSSHHTPLVLMSVARPSWSTSVPGSPLGTGHCLWTWLRPILIFRWVRDGLACAIDYNEGRGREEKRVIYLPVAAQCSSDVKGWHLWWIFVPHSLHSRPCATKP